MNFSRKLMNSSRKRRGGNRQASKKKHRPGPSHSFSVTKTEEKPSVRTSYDAVGHEYTSIACNEYCTIYDPDDEIPGALEHLESFERYLIKMCDAYFADKKGPVVPVA